MDNKAVKMPQIPANQKQKQKFKNILQKRINVDFERNPDIDISRAGDER